jgi:hypothetical protein
VSTRFPCQMMFESLNSNTAGATTGAGTSDPSPVLSGIHVVRSLVFSVICSVLLIIHLVSSNFSYTIHENKHLVVSNT